MKRITIVGSGVYAATLCEQLAAAPFAQSLAITLAARNQRRLVTIGNYCEHRIASRRDWTLRTETNLASAVEGADIIVLLVRVGGLQARAYDETFPTWFGQIGDEGLGLGGLSNTWRTLPVLQSIADTITNVAPAARVINMLAPLGTTTRLLQDAGLNAVGICELPITTEEDLGGSRSLFDYAGLNHLGWFTPNCDAGCSVLNRAVEAGLTDETVARELGAAGLFYYYRVFDPAAAARMGCGFKLGRAMQLQDLTERVLAEFERPEVASSTLNARATPWFDRGLIPILTALFDETGRAGFDGFVNTTNDGLVPQLPDDGIVEVRATWREDGATPTACQNLDSGPIRFLQAVCEADSHAYQAAVARDPHKLRQAISALPLPILTNQHAAIVDAIVRPQACESRAA